MRELLVQRSIENIYVFLLNAQIPFVEAGSDSNSKELYQTYYIILDHMPDVQVKISTASLLMDKIDKIVEEGYFQNRTEALNEAIRLLIKRYQLEKIKTRIETIREDTEKYPGISGIVESMHIKDDK